MLKIPYSGQSLKQIVRVNIRFIDKEYLILKLNRALS